MVAVGISTISSKAIYSLRRGLHDARALGNYGLEEELGSGGMGIVYRATHAVLRRPTAIKLLRPEAASQVNVSRFEREVRLTARLTHPNTIAVYDYGRSPEGLFYYAMEYVDGVDLDLLVENHGPLPPGRIILILEQVAASLAEAHDLGLIHRDVKPANIMIGIRGGIPDMVKVLDFGLVKNVRRDESSLSSVEKLKGTPHFISPEDILTPADVDGCSDLYALGGVAYYLLTGEHVFEGVDISGHTT